MKSVLPAAALLAAALPLGAACVVVDSQGHIAREEKRFTVAGAPELHLTTFDGSIEIRSGDAKTVVVEIEKRGPTQEALAQLKVETKQDGNRIDVEVRKPAGGDVVLFGIGHSSPTARLIVTMPRDGNVVARSGDGSVRIEHVHGSLDLRTGDGSIRGIDVGGTLSVQTGDGSVTLEDAEGDLDVNTGDGSVSVSGKLGALRLHTSDGSITLRADRGTTMKDDWSLSTGDGGVAIYLPSDFAAEVDAHTGDGSVRSELDIALRWGVEPPFAEGQARRGREGAEIRTGDGSIRLKQS